MKWTALVLFVVTVAAGVAGGLYYAWVLDPIQDYDATPDTLQPQDRFVYLALIGDLYIYEDDLSQAEARLEALGIQADGSVLAGLIEEYLDGGGRPEEVRNLARLAEVLGASGGILLVFASVPAPSPEVALRLSPQPEASQTPAPTSTAAPSFRLVEQTAVCAQPGQPGQIAVSVWDPEGNGLSGVEIVVSWATGQDHFMTGLRPEQGAGYADFQMAPQTQYEVSLAGFRGDVAQGLTSDLSPGLCPTGTVGLDWRVTFQEVP